MLNILSSHVFNIQMQKVFTILIDYFPLSMTWTLDVDLKDLTNIRQGKAHLSHPLFANKYAVASSNRYLS